MKLSELILPPWLMPLMAVLAAAFLAFSIYSYGVDTERARWVNKENAELVARQTKILHLTTANRELERKAVLDANHLKTVYEGKLQDEKNHANAVITAVRAGTKRVYVTTKAVSACSGGLSLAPAAGPQVSGETRAELSGSSFEFFAGESTRANKEVIESNHVKDLLLQCHAHVDALRSQQIPTEQTGE